MEYEYDFNSGPLKGSANLSNEPNDPGTDFHVDRIGDEIAAVYPHLHAWKGKHVGNIHYKGKTFDQILDEAVGIMHLYFGEGDPKDW